MSVVYLAFAINLGLPAVYTAFMFGHDSYEVATSLGLLFLLVALMLTKHRTPTVPAMNGSNRRAWMRPGVFAVFVLGLYGAFLALYLYEPLFKAFWRPVIGLFPALFAASAFFALSANRYVLCAALGLAGLGSIAVYLNVAFDLFGRLNVAAMLLAVVIIASWVRPGWVYKVAILAAAPLGLAWAGLHRTMGRDVTLGVESARYTFETGSGLGSIFAPFTTLADIVERSDVWGIRPATEWLEQVVFSVFFWVPRVWWSEKPEGFGRVMVYELLPQYSQTGHSMAASAYGEFVYYAGVLGPLSGTLLIIAFTRLLVWAQEWAAKSRSSVWIIYFVLLAYMLAQAMTLVWGGLAAYVVRGFAPVFGLAGLFLVWWLLRGGFRVVAR
ncbi:MAG: hypothetical protein ACNA71_10010 [Kiritimatiellia bacterium]